MSSSRTATDDIVALAPIPIDSKSVFDVFAADVANAVANLADETLHVVLDGRSASSIGALTAFVGIGGRYTVLLAEPEPHGIDPNLRVVMMLSSTVSVALLASDNANNKNAVDGIRGGWTGCRQQVRNIAAALIPEYDDVPVSTKKNAIAEWTELLTSLTARYVRLVRMDSSGREHHLSSVLSILKAISAKRRSHDVLYVFVERIARILDVDRCSVVRIWGGEDVGHVLASHDDEALRDREISLTKYPELRASMTRFERIVIDDAYTDPLMKECAADLRRAGLQSIVVVPVLLLDPNVGSLFLRVVRKTRAFSNNEVEFCAIVAEAAANALERSQLFESIQQANERLELLAVTDDLTGLHNHRFFRHRIEEECDRGRRYRLPLALMLFDIDDFKLLNDRYGHLQGDQVLRDIGRHVRNVTRRTDIAARYGGEEFAIIMPLTDAEGGVARAERLREEVAGTMFHGLPPGVRVTVSVGVACLNHDTMLDCEALIRDADIALYEAKRQGKNRVALAEHEGDAS